MTDPKEDIARANLDRLIRERGADFASLSRLLNRNAAYVQQYIRRKIPRKLDEDDRRTLAEYFGDDLATTRHVLRRHGNMSSPTVLFVLAELLAAGPIEQPMLMTALGPGFVGAMGLLTP